MVQRILIKLCYYTIFNHIVNKCLYFFYIKVDVVIIIQSYAWIIRSHKSFRLKNLNFVRLAYFRYKWPQMFWTLTKATIFVTIWNDFLTAVAIWFKTFNFVSDTSKLTIFATGLLMRPMLCKMSPDCHNNRLKTTTSLSHCYFWGYFIWQSVQHG